MKKHAPTPPVDLDALPAGLPVTEFISTAGDGGKNGSQTRITCDPIVSKTPSCLPSKYHCGLDKLKVSFWIEWGQSGTTPLLETLEIMKQELQASEKDLVKCFEYKSFTWNLHRTGTRIFTYRLTMGDVVLMFNRRKAEGQMPTARLEIGSLSSQTAAKQIYTDVKHWLKLQGGRIIKERISEVHLAADFFDTDIKRLGIQYQDRWIMKAHTFNTHYIHRRLSGISIGKGDFALRIYNKVLELQKSHHKQEVFAQLWGFDTYSEKPVTRVEYQIRRSILKEFVQEKEIIRINTVEDLFSSLQSLWSYCTSHWSRFMKEPIDRKNKHQSRAQVSDFWRDVQQVKWDFGKQLVFFRDSEVKHKDLEAMRKQALGLYMSIVADQVEDLKNLTEISERCHAYLETDLQGFYNGDQHEFIRRMAIKKTDTIVDTVPF